MKHSIAAILLLLGGCSTYPPAAEPAFAGWHRNACLPEAAAMTEGLKKSGVRAKVLVLASPKWNHAVTVYLYPQGNNRLWVWDSDWKSNEVRAWWNDPQGIARAWLAVIGSSRTITTAKFIE